MRAIQRRAPAFDDEGSGNLQQDVANEEDSGAKAEHAVTEMQIMGHLEGSVSHIHSVEERNDIEQLEKRKQAAADAASGTLRDSQRRQEIHEPAATTETAAAMASPISRVLALPPRSGVCTSRRASTVSRAFSTACAALGSPRWSSIIAPDQI